MKLEQALEKVDCIKNELKQLKELQTTGEVNFNVTVHLSQGGINDLKIKETKELV